MKAVHISLPRSHRQYAYLMPHCVGGHFQETLVLMVCVAVWESNCFRLKECNKNKMDRMNMAAV